MKTQLNCSPFIFYKTYPHLCCITQRVMIMMMRTAMAVTEIAMLSVLSGGSGKVSFSTRTIVKSVCSRNFSAELAVITKQKIMESCIGCEWEECELTSNWQRPLELELVKRRSNLLRHPLLDRHHSSQEVVTKTSPVNYRKFIINKLL